MKKTYEKPAMNERELRTACNSACGRRNSTGCGKLVARG